MNNQAYIITIDENANAQINSISQEQIEQFKKELSVLGKIGTLKATTAWVHNIRLECVECTHCGYKWVMETDYDLEFYKEQWSYCPFCGATLVKEN